MKWVLGCLALIAALAMAGYPVYVKPQVDPLRKADAILIVGGADPLPRYRYGFELAGQGWAPHLLVSDPDRQLTRVCDAPHAGFSVECFVPAPRTTFGEARELRRLATERHWRTVIVVAYPPHISRARYIMERCYDGDLIMAAAPARLSIPDWVWMYGYQSAAYLKSVFTVVC